MADSLSQADAVIAKYGLTQGVTWGGTGHESTPNINPKGSGFNLAAVPGQVGGMALEAGKAIGHAALDPFAHIGRDLLTSAKVYSQANDQNGQRDKIMTQMKGYKQDFAAGRLSKDQYQAKLKETSAELQGMSDSIAATEAPIKDETLGSIAKDVGGAAITALTLGEGALVKAGVQGTAKAAAEGLGEGLGAKAVKLGADVIDGTIGAGKVMGGPKGGIVSATAGKLARNAIVGQPTLNQSVELGQNIHDGNLKQAAINAGLLIGVPVAAGVLVPKIAQASKAAGKAIFGTKSFIHDIPTSDGPKGGIPKFVDQNPDKIVGQVGGEDLTAKQAAEMMQHYNIAQQGGDLSSQAQHMNASQKYTDWLSGTPSESLSPEQHLAQFAKMAEAVNAVRADAVAGTLLKPNGANYTLAEIKNLWVGRFSNGDRTSIINQIQDLGSTERSQAIRDLAEHTAWGQNKNLVEQLVKAAGADNFKGEINALNPTQDLRGLGRDTFVTDQPHDIPNGADLFDEAVNGHAGSKSKPIDMADAPAEKTGWDAGPEPRTEPLGQAVSEASDYGGYIPIQRAKGTQLPGIGEGAGLIKGKDGMAVGKWIEKHGLSPYATPQGSVTASVTNHLIDTFAEHPSPALQNQGSEVFAKLLKATNGAGGVYDPRMLTINQVITALGKDATRQDAIDVMKAVRQGYKQVPSELVGSGGKLTNKALNDIPFMNQYMKIQGIAKFSANPFFYLKQLTKSGIIAVLHGADHFSPSAETDALMHKLGLYSKMGSDAGITDGLNLEGMGKGVSDITRPIQKIIGGLAESMARSHGMTVEQALSHPEIGPEMNNALRIVTSYPRGGYLNSPLAKTLNVAIFPSRFETKVLQAVGHAFGHQPPVVQAAMATGIMNMSTFLGSPAGEQWQKDNSESLGLLKYFTPIALVEEVAHFLGKGGHGGHIADLGSIGGLPFGVITTILQHQGIPLGTLDQSPYIDPKTGQVIPSKVPVTAWGHAQQAVTDLIGSTFSFPGKQAGFDVSKTDLVTAIPGLKKDPKDYKTVAPDHVDESQAPEIPLDEGATTVSGKSSFTGTEPATEHINITPRPIKASTAKTKASKVVPLDKQIKH